MKVSVLNEFEPWIADCHFQAVEGDAEYRCQAAIWANNSTEFRTRLDGHLAGGIYKTLWLEECLPANEYISRHGQQKKIGDLARAVHPGHVVELSQMLALEDGEEPEPESYLVIDEIEIAPLPDQTGIPFWDQEWISQELKELLFAQGESGPKLRTYCILDATLRKNITGVFDLDSVDVPVKCLFKGEAAKEMQESAPYLLDMTLPEEAWDNRDLVPAFHRSFFERHWGQNTGIFIRTTALMSEVWNHFRKFTKAQVEADQRWVFFRFWDPRIAGPYFRGRKSQKDSVEQWFGGRGLSGPDIFAETNAGKQVIHFSPSENVDLTRNVSRGSLVLTNEDLVPFKMTQKQKTTEKTATLLRENFGSDLRHLSDDLLLREISLSVERMQGYGLSKMDNLYITSAWAAFYGHDFETKDPTGELLRICQSDLSEGDKMSALRSRLTKMKPKGEAT